MDDTFSAPLRSFILNLEDVRPHPQKHCSLYNANP